MNANIIGQTLLNQFRVDSFIAAGGMGAVYKVWDMKRNVPLAMKVMHAELAEDPSIFKRFEREARAMQKLAHPNIVPFYGIFKTGDFSFLLERYVNGPTLKDIMKEKGKPMPLDDTLIYLKAVCAALGYAHAYGVVHCDVKPGNVMIERSGGIFLTDFGIARHAESSTTTLASAGTAAYMAPEQIRGDVVSPATDVYALGIMAFEMLTGQRPFRGVENGAEKGGATANERVRYGHLSVPAPDPRQINSNISPMLAQVVLRALAKNPAQRFQNAQEFFNALCHAAQRQPGQIPDEAVIPGQFNEPSSSPSPHVSRASHPMPIPARKQQNTALVLMIMAGVLFVALSILGIIIVMSSQPTLEIITTQPSLALSTNIPTFTALAPITPSETVAPFPTETPTLAPTIPPTPTKTKQPECPGAPPQRVTVGDRIRICTDSGDSLFIRKDPGLNGKAPILAKKNAYLFIVGGPVCADNAAWWNVTVPIGTSAIMANTGASFQTTEEITGWIREGDYNDPKGDLYFICKEP